MINISSHFFPPMLEHVLFKPCKSVGLLQSLAKQTLNKVVNVKCITQ